MDKESELSPVVQPFVPKCHRRNDMESRDISSLLPNPHTAELTSRGDPAAQNQTPLETLEDWQRGVTSKHGYSKSCQARGPTKAKNYPPSERSIADHQEKDKNNVPRSLDVPRRAFRGTRSVPNSAEKTQRSKQSQSDQITFEVKMSEFPELGLVTPGRPALPTQQKPLTCWGPALSSSTPDAPQSVTTRNTLSAGKGLQRDLRLNASKTALTSSTARPKQQTEAVAPTNSSGSTGSSWANVASRPPKKSTLKEKTNTPEEEISLLSEQGASEKKKRKKKKKKSKSAGEEDYLDESEDLVHQDPPKLEDEEEFPDLSLVLAVPNKVLTNMNTAKLSIKEGNKGLSDTKMGDQKDKSSAGKTLPIEAPKKSQKPDKASGKKSKVPVQLDIGNMLAVLEKKQQSQKCKQDAKPLMLLVGGALPVGHKQSAVQKKLPWQHDKIAHNPLDSTSPLVKKGKQREVPKAKKPTPLKRVILKEREERKHNRLLEEKGLLPQEIKPDQDTGTEDPCETTDNHQDQEQESNGRSSPNVSEGPEDNQPLFCELSEAEGEREGDTEKELEEASKHRSIEPKPCPSLNLPKIHSRKFRDYCSQVLSKDVDECVSNLLKELVRFQDRLYQKDPMKARMKRRLVMGLREVLKHLKLKKVKCVVISPNCERIQSKGGLDEALHNIIDTCREQGVPFVFALSRKALGRCVNKVVPVSLVGIFNYDGAQDHYHKMIELSSEARRAYEVMIENLELSSQSEVEAEQENSPESLGIDPAPMPSDCTEPEEPDYIKLWKKMLEKECNHKFLNFEVLGSVPLANDCNEQITEVERR